MIDWYNILNKHSIQFLLLSFSILHLADSQFKPKKLF